MRYSCNTAAKRSVHVLLAACACLAGTVCTVQAHILPFHFGMTGNQVVPGGTDSSAHGSGLLTYNHHTFNYDLDLFITGISLNDLLDVGPNGTPIQIFNAPRGQNGDVVLDPGFYGNFVQDGNGIRLTLSTIRIGGQQGNLNTSIFDNENALFDGNLYIQIFTTQYPNGEIRGQLPPYGRFLRDDNLGAFAAVKSATQIPAPASYMLLSLGGLGLVSRRRRPSSNNT